MNARGVVHRIDLRRQGGRPALDGQEGLKKARSENPDLIILDVFLPKMNGYKVCRLLKFDSKYKHIPIIMLTSRETKRHEKIGFETGADGLRCR